MLEGAPAVVRCMLLMVCCCLACRIASCTGLVQTSTNCQAAPALGWMGSHLAGGRYRFRFTDGHWHAGLVVALHKSRQDGAGGGKGISSGSAG